MSRVIQTFYVDPAAVQQANHVMVSSIDLYFKAKPGTEIDSIGRLPGVTVELCPVEGDAPVYSRKYARICRRSASDINISTNSTVGTNFGFTRPILITPGQSYGIVITTEDDRFALWQHVSGHRAVGTNIVSAGLTGARSGKYFQSANPNTTEVTGTSLKFKVNIADFSTQTLTVDLVNTPCEFLTINGRVGLFEGGETVFANTATIAGTVAVIANSNIMTGSNFSSLIEGQSLVIRSGTNSQVNQIKYISNNTSLEMTFPANFTNALSTIANGVAGKIHTIDYVNNTLTLTGSTSVVGQTFLSGALITGETSKSTALISSINNINVDKLGLHLGVITNTGANTGITYNVSYSNGSSYIVSGDYSNISPGDTTIPVGEPRYILSRSNELASAFLATTENRSANVKVVINSAHRFAAPMIDLYNSDISVERNIINSSTIKTYANNVTYDSEVFAGGIGKAKHITTKMTFDRNRQAEDLRVYLSAWRPEGTEVQAYAKFLNSGDGESFDDKLWTPLILRNSDMRSSSNNRKDVIEYTYDVPSFPLTQQIVSNSFNTVLNSNILTTTGGAPSTQFIVGQHIKIYSPLFPDNYMVTTVTATSATTVTVSTPLTYAGIIGNSMSVDILKYKGTAFIDKPSGGILKYININNAVYSRYNTVQVKLVLTSLLSNVAPYVDQVEVIGVSA